DEELQIDTFSYCLRKRCYHKLPEFTFCTLIISNCPASYSESTPFGFDIFGNSFIKFKEERRLDSKYVSLYSSKNNNYRPIFLNQNSNKINIKYVDCRCNKTCSICTSKTLKISKRDNIECKVFYLR